MEALSAYKWHKRQDVVILIELFGLHISFSCESYQTSLEMTPINFLIKSNHALGTIANNHVYTYIDHFMNNFIM